MSTRSHRERYALPGHRGAEADLKLEGARLHGRITVGETERAVDARVSRAPDGVLTLRVGDRTLHARVVEAGGTFLVALAGRVFEVTRPQAGAANHAHVVVEPFATSPMTGLVAKVAVTAGAEVAAGAPLFVVEAMKMEYVVRAPRAVKIAEVRRRAGEKVALGEVVVTFKEPA